MLKAKQYNYLDDVIVGVKPGIKLSTIAALGLVLVLGVTIWQAPHWRMSGSNSALNSGSITHEVK